MDSLLCFSGIFHLQQTCLRCWTRGALVNKAFRHSGKAFVQGNLSLHSLIYGYVEQIKLDALYLLALIVVLQVNTILISTFIGPPVKLIKAHPWIKSFIERIKGRFKKPETDMHQIALDACKQTRNELVMLMRVMVTLIVFGAAVPPLLMMAPLFCWLYLCVLTWLEQYSNSADKGLETMNQVTEAIDAIGDRVAETMATAKAEDEDEDGYADDDKKGIDDTSTHLAANLLVQQPIPTFWACIHVACYACGMLQMLDLNFDIGPIILWTVLNIVAAAVALWLFRMVRAAKHPNQQRNAVNYAEALWKAPTNPIHKESAVNYADASKIHLSHFNPRFIQGECGLDDFSSREISHRIEMNPIARRAEIIANLSSKSDDKVLGPQSLRQIRTPTPKKLSHRIERNPIARKPHKTYETTLIV